MLGKALIGLGVGATSVGMGAAAGAYQGQTEGNAATGATIGGVVGLGLGVGAIATGLNADKIVAGVGSAVVGAGTKAYEFAASGALKEMAIGSAKAIGTGAKAVGGVAASTVGVAAPIAGVAALKAGAKYGNIATGMFKVNPDFLSKDSGRMLNLSKRGTAMVGVGAIGSMVAGGVKAFNDSKAGVSDGQVTRATPNASAYSSQMRNAGATGDLAFAMRAQRHG